MPTTTTTENGTPLRWQDKTGVMHAAEGAELAPPDHRTFVLWTACGKHDVPAGKGFASYERVTCAQCAAKLS
jgi:hypothetical protein